MSHENMQTVVIEPKSGNVKNMVLFLHGYGSNKDDLISIGREWQDALPDTIFISPNAPERCEQMMFGESYQWYGLRSTDVKDIEDDGLVAKAFETLNSYIDAKLAEYGLGEENLAVVGFSQGAMMTTYTMPRRSKACAGIIAYSGFPVGGDDLKNGSVVKMPILALHGEADDVVPPFNLDMTQKLFDEAGFEIETIMRPGVAHGIDMFGLTRGMEFVKECLYK